MLVENVVPAIDGMLRVDPIMDGKSEDDEGRDGNADKNDGHNSAKRLLFEHAVPLWCVSAGLLQKDLGGMDEVTRRSGGSSVAGGLSGPESKPGSVRCTALHRSPFGLSMQSLLPRSFCRNKNSDL